MDVNVHRYVNPVYSRWTKLINYIAKDFKGPTGVTANLKNTRHVYEKNDIVIYKALWKTERSYLTPSGSNGKMIQKWNHFVRKPKHLYISNSTILFLQPATLHDNLQGT